MGNIRLKATRQTHGDYGTVAPGEIFEVGDPDTAKSLVDRGIATRASGSDRSTRKGKGASETKSRSSRRSGAKRGRKAGSSKVQGTAPDSKVVNTGSYRGSDQTGEPGAGGGD